MRHGAPAPGFGDVAASLHAGTAPFGTILAAPGAAVAPTTCLDDISDPKVAVLLRSGDVAVVAGREVSLLSPDRYCRSAPTTTSVKRRL